MNQMVNMIVRMVMRQLIRTGIDKGSEHLARRNGGGEATPAQKGQARQAQKRMRQGMRMIRRMGRF